MVEESSSGQDRDEPFAEFVEIDPSGRYGRYEDVLGKGAVKTVYKAFDELEGIEVAWNQVKVMDLRRSSVDLDRLYSEVRLLKALKHRNIIKFYDSWIDTKNDNVNFITEVLTSGTLRQYRKKHKQVDIKALKNWSRQILSGLCYLHSHDPPVIHRDLKCDNIFVNGNHGELKIGDLGSAAILRYAHSACSIIGTPEFMAPELYEEDYNELVDIYAFGMCLLELVTFQYPYSECSNAAQIYKKVTSGIKPPGLAEVKDPEIKGFINKCIADVSVRLSAKELLLDSFLQSEGGHDRTNYSQRSSPNLTESNTVVQDFCVQRQRQDMNTIFLKLQIVDSTGQPRNIHFPFDIEEDTPVCVATEMVAELDLTDQDVTAIAEMIDTEIKAYVPNWKPGDASDSDGPGNEAAEEVPASPASADQQSACVFLENIPSQSDSRKVDASPQLDSDEHSSTEDYRTSDDSFNYDTDKEEHSNASSMPKQYTDSPHQSERGGREQAFASPAALIDSGSFPSHWLNQDKESPSGSGSLSWGRGAYSKLHGRDDSHSHETLEVDESTNFQPIIEELEYLFIEQMKELEEVQRAHNSAIEELLKGLTAEKHIEVLHTCRWRVEGMKEQTPI